MKIVQNGETLSVSGIDALADANSNSFTSELSAALPSEISRIDIDLSQTAFADCSGIGALLAVRKRARHRNANVTIRVLNPTPPMLRIFNLTRMDDVFSIERQ